MSEGEHHEHSHSEHVHHHVNKKKVHEKLRDNPWILSTIVLGVLVLILVISSFYGSTGKVISGEKAGVALAQFLNTQTGGGVEYSSSEDAGSLYEINVTYQGNEIPVYVTKDGKYYVQGVVPIISSDNSDSTNSNTNSQTVPKSDKPSVELFIWGYCPYGVQAQGPLADVAKLLGNYADFKSILYYDGHGAFETQENKIQECIQNIAPDKYWAYASRFVSEIYPNCSATRTVDCDKTESVKLMNSLGIDSNKVLSCVSSQGVALTTDASNYAKEMGVTGSPTLFINGVKVNVARNAEAFKTAVCDAFNNAPAACNTVLDSGSNAAQGNC